MYLKHTHKRMKDINNITTTKTLLPVVGAMKRCEQITTVQLKDKIGQGGFGTVYKCVDETGIEMAMKCIKSNNNGIPCLMETSIMSTIHHPNINKAVKIHPTYDKLYILQELAICDLIQWRRENTPTENEIKKWTHQLLQAVACLHKHDIIHGDIKASNVLLHNNGSIKLSDFTLSTKKEWPNNYSVCTPTHRPLEVWLDRQWDEKIDIWSLGCTFFEIVYGYSIFPRQDVTDVNIDLSDHIKKLIVRDKFINAILDWGDRNPSGKQFYNLTYKNSSYYRFSLTEKFDKNSDINRIILSMLQLNHHDRPTIFELLNDPYYINLSITPETIISTQSVKLSLKTEKRIKHIMDNYLPSTNKIGFNLVYELFTRLTGLVNISDINKIIGCIWIVYKLIYRCTIDNHNFPIDLKDIRNIEQTICIFLSFRLHSASLNSINFSRV